VRTVTTKRLQLITLHDTNMRRGPHINVDLQPTASQIEVIRPRTVEPYYYEDVHKMRCSGQRLQMETRQAERSSKRILV